MRVRRSIDLCVVSFLLIADAIDVEKEDVDKVIEDEITRKLGEDLIQSIERKFQVDLERSVDMVLIKIKLLLQNGTQHIQDKLLDIQGALDMMKSQPGNEVDKCLTKINNETSSLAEKALHQMVVCGYALIGQDPAKAVRKVVDLKTMIRDGVKPLQEQKVEIYALLKACGHDHDSLKKVVKCVISKSPMIKSAMMDVTGKLIEGIVDLTKLMAHGAMHEACLIEVIKTTEDEAVELVKTVRKCAFDKVKEFDRYMKENNATVIDVPNINKSQDKRSVKEMQEVIRNMLNDTNDNNMDERFKEKWMKVQNDLNSVDANANIIDIANDLKNIV